MNYDFLSPAQCAGYVVMALGITAYLQRNDRRLKLFDAMQNIAYCVHFYLLGNPVAVATAAVACICSLCAVRQRSVRLALVFIAANVVIGLAFCTHGYQLFAAAGCGLVAWAMFTMQGLPMRLVILAATVCWLVNDFLSGSIGGTLLEVFILAANSLTIIRLTFQRKAA
jgi:hypothetical protein